MKVLIFIDHDIMIRHFIHSQAFAHLISHHEVLFVLPGVEEKRIRMELFEAEAGAPVRRLSRHGRRLRFWRNLFLVEQLRWRPGKHFAGLRRLRREAIGPKATVLFSVLCQPLLRQIVCWWWRRKLDRMPNTELNRLLEEEQPDIIVHPSVLDGIYINDLTESGRVRGVPVVIIMNSWDNPSTKEAMAGQPDYLLVWGKQTQNHAVQFIGMPIDRVVPFGAAQFDVYRNPSRVSRNEFCRTHEISPESRILLYAGSSKNTDEFSHLTEIENAIETGRLGDTIVVYRPHPWGGGGRGGERMLKHAWKHVRIESSMLEYLVSVRAGDAHGIYPDYRHTHDVLSSVDAVLSPLSTILIEGALHGKPILCFLPEEENEARHFQLVASLKHFEDMYNMPEFLIALGRGELLPMLETLLSTAGDEVFAAHLKTACTHFVEPFGEPYDVRLTSFLEHLVDSENTTLEALEA